MARARESQPIITTLPNGVRVAFRHIKAEVECCGVAISAGSRDETDREWGLAHFVEHTIFKGTDKRRSHHVLNRMESVGGELNAYTTKEETFVYTVAPAGNMARSLELIADLICNSTFPCEELDRERVVVIDEINSYLDSPADAAYDDFEDLIFRNSSLGHNILGTPRSVRKLTQLDCLRWICQKYTAGRIVVFYSGPGSQTRYDELVSRYFADIRDTYNVHKRKAPEKIASFDVTRNIHSHQAHTVMGLRLPLPSPRERMVFNLWNNVLGGPGMNSRLNVALRERNGLVYSVESSLSYYSDVVLWTCYFGCDKEYVERCRELVNQQLKNLAEKELTSRAIAMARRQYLGQIIVAGASVENSAIALGRAVLRGNEYRTVSQLADLLNDIRPEDIVKCAEDILRRDMSFLTFK